MANDNLDRQLDELFAAYRDACPEVEGSPEFMPRLWQKIEARQSAPLIWWRFTRAFVSAAACLCLLMTALFFMPSHQQSPVISLLDVLDSEHETMAYADIPETEITGDLAW